MSDREKTALTVGIVGLGTIGGSFAKAIQAETAHRVLGADRNGDALAIAMISGAIDGELTAETLADCDLLLIALYPPDAVSYLKENAPFIPASCVVMDCCGVKRAIFDECKAISKKHGFVYVGGHPMAGAVKPGFVSAREKMFRGASMILVPGDFDDLPTLGWLCAFFRSLGFTRIVKTTPEEHDRRIAFTSQLPHVVSNAYVKSPVSREHRGFSAGSYRDLSRVAKVNVPLWTELFLENADDLADELEILIRNLEEYRDALVSADREKLASLLQEGADCKDEADERS